MPSDDFFAMIEKLEAWGRYPAWRRRVLLDFVIAIVVAGIITVALLP